MKILTQFLLFPFFLLADDFKPRNTQAEGQHPPTPEEALAKITVPDGFQVSLFAGEPDVHQPVAMVTDDRGRIWVAESYSYKEWKKTGEDRIVILEDSDGDGQHDKRTIFWSGGNHISGMTVGWGGVWICSAPNLLFIPDRDRDDVPDGEPEVVLDGWTTNAGHNFFNGLTWGIDGWLYGRHGITRPSLVGVPGSADDERLAFDCSIWRFHPVTKKFEIVCRGTTNPWGTDWNAEGELFFTNNVNGHLWHAVPGALFPRMGNRADANVKFDYERMPMTADHLHHAGTINDWTKTRDGVGIHGDLGGGHSHCGGMIYLADNWPEEYSGRIFMCNTHGRRMNQNILERYGSGYVGRRAPDLFFANQPWFRGVTVMYGPDGGVFISDWTDLGECHDNDGVHRSSGRIFKMTYGQPESWTGNLSAMPTATLAEYQLHPNEWFARQARHILQYRAAIGDDIHEAMIRMKQVFADDPHIPTKIRALLTLYAMDVTGELFHAGLLSHEDEHLRKWGVRLLLDEGAPSPEALKKLIALAKTEKSSIVRLYLASALQKLAYEDRWELAGILSQHSADADDQNLPLMVWFGVKDAVAANPKAGISWLNSCGFEKLHRFTARVIGETAASPENLAALLDRLDDNIAEGLIEGLAGRTNLPSHPKWAGAKSRLENADLAQQLGLLLDRQNTLTALENADDARSLRLLIDARAPGIGKTLVAALEKPSLRPTALAGLSRISTSGAAEKILALYEELPPAEKIAAIETLVSNQKNAAILLAAVEFGDIPAGAVSAFQARKIHSMKDNHLRKQLTKVWGKLKSTSGEKQRQIKDWQNQLTGDVIADANLESGKTLFEQRCAVCHTFFANGGKLGPDLTGANRTDVFYLLENIIDPSATLPKDYHVTSITKKDSTVIAGTISQKTDYTLTLSTPAGDVIVSRDDIKSQETSPISLMPEGMLNGLTHKQVRDLIGYLMR